MRLLIYEHLSALKRTDPATGGISSLDCEGLSMLKALVEDFSLLDNPELIVPCSEEIFGEILRNSLSRVTMVRTEAGDSAEEFLDHWLPQVSAALLVAPEIDGVLENLTLKLEASGARNLGSSSEAVRLASDKCLLAEHLQQQNIPAIPALLLQDALSNPAVIPPGAVVIKPRFGAGSQETVRYSCCPERESLLRLIQDSRWLHQGILQPAIEGKALSVAVWCAGDGCSFVPLPVCDQLLSQDGKFTYLGGCVPSPDLLKVPEISARVFELATQACRAIPGLRGYVGVDLILQNNGLPIVCEVNPRLTTSYIGYRALSRVNLARQWLELRTELFDWLPGRVDYACQGTIRLSD